MNDEFLEHLQHEKQHSIYSTRALYVGASSQVILQKLMKNNGSLC